MRLKNKITVFFTLLTLLFSFSGCGPLLFAGGAAAGYGTAKDMQDGELIDSDETQKEIDSDEHDTD